MKCDLCGEREAVVFVHQIAQGAKTELRLCAECAKEKGVNRLDGDIASSLSKLLAAVASGSAASPSARSGKVPDRHCPRCGSALSELRKKGFAGCASCWDFFGPDFLLLLASRSKGVAPKGGASSSRVHIGRIPARLAARRAAVEELSRLKEQLKSAVASEDYENAARCRDRIRALEEEVQSDV